MRLNFFEYSNLLHRHDLVNFVYCLLGAPRRVLGNLLARALTLLNHLGLIEIGAKAKERRWIPGTQAIGPAPPRDQGGRPRKATANRASRRAERVGGACLRGSVRFPHLPHPSGTALDLQRCQPPACDLWDWPIAILRVVHDRGQPGRQSVRHRAIAID